MKYFSSPSIYTPAAKLCTLNSCMPRKLEKMSKYCINEKNGRYTMNKLSTCRIPIRDGKRTSPNVCQASKLMMDK